MACSGHIHARIRPVEPAGHHKPQLLRTGDPFGIELELKGMGLRKAEELTEERLEGYSVVTIHLRERLAPILAGAVGGRRRWQWSLDGVRVLCGERRKGEQFIGVHLGTHWVVQDLQPNAVEVRHLAELFGELHFVEPIPGLHLIAADQDELIVVRRDQHTGGHGQAEGRDPQHVTDEGISLAVPCVEEGARPTEALPLPDVVLTIRQAEHLLDEPVRPRDPQDIDGLTLPTANGKRLAAPVEAAVQRSGTQLEQRSHRTPVVLHALQGDRHRMLGGRHGVAPQVGPVRLDEVRVAIPVHVGEEYLGSKRIFWLDPLSGFRLAPRLRR